MTCRRMKITTNLHVSSIHLCEYILRDPSLIIDRSIFCLKVNFGAGSSTIGCAINLPNVGNLAEFDRYGCGASMKSISLCLATWTWMV